MPILALADNSIAGISSHRHCAITWNRFCAKHPAAWFWHTTAFLDYLAVRAENYSFLYVDDEMRTQAIVPLVFRDGKEVDGYPLPCPLFNDSAENLTEIKHICRDHAEKILKEHRCSPWRVRFSPLVNDYASPCYFLPGEDTTHESVVIDLGEPRDIRWTNLRKSNKGLINKAKRHFTFHVHPEDWQENFRLMHLCERGQTRPTATWDELNHWVESGQAEVFGVKSGDYWIGFELANVYKNSLYNAILTTTERDITSYMLWEISELYAQQGFSHFEIGWYGVATTKKEQAIEMFRKGMGGTLKSWKTTLLYDL